jgi:hypothetical protein
MEFEQRIITYIYSIHSKENLANDDRQIGITIQVKNR